MASKKQSTNNKAEEHSRLTHNREEHSRLSYKAEEHSRLTHNREEQPNPQQGGAQSPNPQQGETTTTKALGLINQLGIKTNATKRELMSGINDNMTNDAMKQQLFKNIDKRKNEINNTFWKNVSNNARKMFGIK